MSTTEERTDPHLPQPQVVAGDGAQPEASIDDEGNRWGRVALLAVALVALGLVFGWWILAVVVALIVSIFLHEMGHYLTAKAAGMKVTEFFLSFGPRLWSFRRGETEYGVKAIPAGAYVKIIGMSNLDEVDPADEARTYRQKSYLRRMSVALGGPAMNLLIGLVLIWTVLVFFGQRDPSSWTIDQISSGEDATARIELFDPGLDEPGNRSLVEAFEAGEGPAQQAGLQEGDRVVEIDGVAVDSFEEMSEYVREHPGDEVTLVIARGDATIETSTTIGSITNEAGEGGFLGVGAAPGPAQTTNPIAAVPRSFSVVGEQIWGSIQGIGSVFTPSGLADSWERLADSATGTSETADEPAASPSAGPPPSADAERPVSIVGAVNLGGQIAEQGVGGMLAFLAAVNIFLGVFNLVPLLPFDGGHVAIGTYEKIREVISGKRRYMADVSKLLPLTYGVLTVVLVFGVLMISNDIIDPPQL